MFKLSDYYTCGLIYVIKKTLFLFGIAVIVNAFILTKSVYAVSTSWDFSVSGDYTLSSSTAVEVAASSARLKVLNYTSDANTRLLLHLDENSGNPTDSSSNANNATATNVSYVTGNLNNAISLDGSASYISVADSASVSLSQTNTIEAWTKFNSAFSAGSHFQRQGVVDKGDYHLYYDNETGKLTYELADNSATNWTQVAGNDIDNSWDLDGQTTGYSTTVIGTDVYASLGGSVGDAEVWKWNGTTWTKIGGDGINSSWAAQTFEGVLSMTNDGTDLYAGLGLTAGDAEVWKYTVSSGTWSRIGGDAINSSWAVNTYEGVYSLYYQGSTLYAGLGLTAGDAEVWSWNGSSWTKIGGDSTNSGWTTGYEGVYNLKSDGTNLYAGLGASGGDNEVWKWNGSAWSKIGGDGVNSGFTSTTHTIIDSIAISGSNVYALMDSGNAGRTAEMWMFNGTTWSQTGGDYVNSSWGFRGLQTVEVMDVSDGYLYAGLGNTNAGNALVWQFDGSNWTLVGGQGINSSWAANTYELVTSMISHQGDLYVGIGNTANDAEVWSWNGSSWTKVGGDSTNSGWTTNYEEVNSLASVNGTLYAGLGNSAGDAEVWAWNGSTWSQVGGTASGNWGTANYDRVVSMGIYSGRLVAGLGSSAGEAEVWQYSGSGTTWTKIGGDTINSSWDSVSYEQVDSLISYNNTLIAGLGTSTGDAEIWQYNGSTWTQIGGDDINSSWTAGTYERARTIVSFNGDLYAGIGNSTGDGEVWQYRGSTWTKIAGNSINAGWSNAIEEVESFSPYKGKLYAGIGTTQNTDTAIWSYGNNGYLQSVTASQDTNWHHIAATYNGSTMKIYIDGVLNNSGSSAVSLPDTTRNVLIGTTYGGREFGKPQGFFQGKIDEVRISDTALTSFTTTPYSSSVQTVAPSTAAMTTQVKNWDGFTTSETLNGGSIGYRLSIDNGTTWKYWNGSQWTTSSSTSDTNSASTINSNISTLSASTGGILWQSIFTGDGTQQVKLNSVSITATADTTDPVNPDTITALSAVAGSPITSGTWYSHTAPNFTWSGATDTGGSGIAGYYVYFDGSSDADPVTQGSFQTSSVYTGSGLTSGRTYYLRIKAKDSAGNIADTAWDAFTYKYDGTNPTNPSTVSVSPAGYAATNSFTFSWPAGSDASSNIAGYQYKTGTSSGTLADWSTTTTSRSVTIPDAAYQTGENTFYLRTIDNAGNQSSTNVSTNFYFAGSGPTAPQYVTVNQATNTTNSFAFSWSAPSSYSGSESDLTYCYTVNTLPSESTCTFTSAGATSLSAGPFATQVGLNIFYVTAKNPDSSGGAINYGVYGSVSFTANTSAPGIPTNVDISDASLKSSSAWKLTVSWAAPSDVGSGVEDYELYRSDDDATYTKIATTTGTAYVDTGLSQKEYYYKVRACDSVENCGSYSTAVTMTPTGRFTSAPSLASGPTVSSITTKKATVTWSTDRSADSKIQYGTKAGSYFTEEPSNSTQATDHTINLTNLSPGTTYYYKAKWTDEDGNTGSSAEKSFSTSAAPTVKDVSAKTISISSAILEFTSKGASTVKIYYGETTAFGGVKTISTSTSETTYTSELPDLKDGTKYYYKINTLDSEAYEYEGTILNFTTLPRPKIAKVKVQQVIGTAQPAVLISWETNTPTSSVVTFFPQGRAGEARDEVNVNLQEGEHQILLRGLVPETNYTIIVSGRDKVGNEAKADAQQFTTATDTRPPKITGLKIEGSIAKSSSDNSKSLAQLVVTWTTDEPSTSQIEFGEGSGTTYSQKTQQDSNMTINHLVVISNLSPSKVYHLRALSNDKAKNEGKSIDSVTITPKALDQALDLVITNLLEVFGFATK